MKERPIIFIDPMVRAILGGRKTQTRRVIKPQPVMWDEGLAWKDEPKPLADLEREMIAGCPYGRPGDVLWVREMWMPETEDGTATGSAIYKATDKPSPDGDTPLRWRPSIHMPRWASRLTLRITDVRVQRVQEISEKDADAEGVGACFVCGGTGAIEVDGSDQGCPNCHQHPYSLQFQIVWDSINAKRGYSWEGNPWVWVISFERVPA